MLCGRSQLNSVPNYYCCGCMLLCRVMTTIRAPSSAVPSRRVAVRGQFGWAKWMLPIGRMRFRARTEHNIYCGFGVRARFRPNEHESISRLKWVIQNPNIFRTSVCGVSVFQIYSTAAHMLYCKYVFVCYALYIYTLYICKSSQPQYLLHNK